MEHHRKRESSFCFICNDSISPAKHKKPSSVTEFSEQTISDIFESFVGFKISNDDENIICESCFQKFNEFDEHQTIANQKQLELTRLYHISRGSSDVFIKSEIKDEDYELPFDFAESLSVSMIDDIKHSTDSLELKKDGRLSSEFSHRETSKVKKPKRQKRKPQPECGSSFDVEGVTYFRCEHCGKAYRSKEGVRTHESMHTQERNYQCDICGTCFKTPRCVQKHKHVHTKNFLQCDLCPSRFKQKYQLKCHLESIHLGKRDHICQFCGKTFGRSIQLGIHLRIHSNEKKIVCEVCGFKAFTRNKMNRHMKTHSGERNFECQICGKRFLYDYNLTAHVKHVHQRQKRPETNQQKLFCKVCGLKFPKIWRVKQHMAEVHKIEESAN